MVLEKRRQRSDDTEASISNKHFEEIGNVKPHQGRKALELILVRDLLEPQNFD